MHKAAVLCWLALSLTFALALFSPQSAYAATTEGTLQGTVRDDSGRALVGANIIINPGNQRTKTDKSGTFLVTGLTPGTYTVRVEIVTFKPQQITVSITQDQTQTTDLILEKSVISTGVQRVRAPQVQRGQTSTQSTISAKLEQETKSQPNNLYQFPGLIFGQPGVTFDPSGYTHIRGTDFNQVGFNVDGIQVTEPMTNSFATNIVTVGLKSATLITGGADASYGNASGGFINEVTNNGRDLRGGIVEGTFGPSHGWNYSGTNTQYGNVTPDNKFDYYASTIGFQNDFPGNTQIQKLGASFDGVIKLNYYADPNNTITAFHNQGFEQYDNYEPRDADPLVAQQYKFEENQRSTQATGVFQQDHSDQQYDFSYVSYKHNFDPKSYLTYRVYRLQTGVTFHNESVATYQNRHSNTIGNQLDYAKQLNTQNNLRFGLAYVPSTTKFHSISDLANNQLLPVFNPDGTRATDGTSPYEPGYGYNDRVSRVAPTQYNAYVSNHYAAPGNKASVDLGLRYAQMHYGFKANPSYSAHYFDPRVGLTYSPSSDLVIRSSYASASQFADSRLLELLFPEQTAAQAGITAFNPGNPLDYVGLDPDQLTSAQRATQYGQLLRRYRTTNHIGPLHSNNVDLGIEKSFNALGGSYAFSATTFRHRQRNLIQYDRTFFVDPGDADGNPLVAGGAVGSTDGQRSYNATGKGNSSGLELVFSRRARNPNDLNGFITYTNQVATATSSDFDTGYIPYFGNAFIGLGGQLGLTDAQFRALNNKQYPTSYDQRHTVAVVVNKRLTKLIEESALLDAGSGFPFLFGGGSADSQHASQSLGGANFNEVPVLLPDQKTLQPLNPVVGRSGWHYKISLNTNFNVTPTTTLFFNVDNVFDKKTVLNYATTTQAGTPYYIAPTAEYPQGRVYYGPSTIITPIFLTFGFRHKF